mmetsp:Transcript_33935/g.54006  ORF Transcript_33935/g.54006 Transcript_33935/m.54006 type:complete len:236 (-) Transcript_33935:53-760(-)
MALPPSVLKRWQDKRRQVVLADIAKDPCALDVVVWADTPLVPLMVDCLFEASISCDPPLRWAICGPEETVLRRTLSRLHASVLHPPWAWPQGLNPYLIPVESHESEVFYKLASRALVVFQASASPLPEALCSACTEHFIDIIDVSGLDRSEQEDQSELIDNILSGTPRCRGEVVRLANSMDASKTDFSCASDAIAVIKALVSRTSQVDETGVFAEVEASEMFAATDFAKSVRSRL